MSGLNGIKVRKHGKNERFILIEMGEIKQLLAVYPESQIYCSHDRIHTGK